jgi:hypothetical protein
VVNPDWRTRCIGGLALEETQISWAFIDSGSVLVGSDDRSILFGGIGPRHEVAIDYSFQVSKQILDLKEAVRISEDSNMEIVSESEWQLAYSRGQISGIDGSSEYLADSAQEYWGKACDGRPFQSHPNSPKIIRRWKSGKAESLTVFAQGTGNGDVADGVRLVIRENSGWSSNPLKIPEKRNISSIFIEEILISLIVGIFPSFVWAFFNASPGYIEEGWLNLVLGGAFFSIFTMLFWRPKQPTWYIESGLMIALRGKKK